MELGIANEGPINVRKYLDSLEAGDSVDALQLVVGLDKNFGVKVPDPAAAKEILHSVSTMAEAVRKKLSGES